MANRTMEQAFSENIFRRQYQTTKRLLVSLILVAACVPICLYFDVWVASNVSYQTLPGELRRIVGFSEVFAHGLGVALILTTIWFAAPELRRRIQSITWLLLIQAFAIFLLKNSLIRIRPRNGRAVEFDSVWETFQGVNPVWTEFSFDKFGISDLQSFPSGHTSTTFILAIGLALIFPRARYLFLVFAGLAASQRVFSQAHYLSDVAGGILLALGLVAVYIRLPAGRILLEETESGFKEPQTLESPGNHIPRMAAA